MKRDSLQASSSGELLEVGGTEAGDGVPALLGGEAVGVAAGVGAGRDVVERGLAGRVEEGVEEPEGALARCDEAVVEERDDGRERGGRRGRAGDALDVAVDDDFEVDALRGDVGVRAAGLVEFALVRLAERGEVAADGGALVVGDREVVREAAGGEVGRGLGADALRRADGGHVRAAGGEGGDELRAAGGLGAGNATVTGGEDDRDTAGAELGVGVAEVPTGAAVRTLTVA